MRLAIRILTYQRSDGKTPYFLRKALESIKNQTYQNYKVFLIGDKYDDNDEFVNIATSIIPEENIFFHNLDSAYEREKYDFGSMQLWCAGGTKASNYCINKLLEEGYSWACHLDHDDFWERTHLESIVSNINKLDDSYIFGATKSTYKGNKILPTRYNNTDLYYPLNGDLIHSSVCVNWRETTLRFRDVFEDEGRYHAGDGDMWERLTEYMKNNNRKGFLVDRITCHHETERE